jgi:molybdopterin synthase catalytic subunit
MQIRVLLFAALREALGELEDGSTIGELLGSLESRHPALAASRGRVLIALNQERASEQTALSEGDEVALLPPVSGGAGRVRIQSSPLSLDELLETVKSPDCGGIVTFTGVVRNVSRGHRIDHLEYEAYEPMALRELERILEDIGRRWPDVRLAVAHRLGRLELGDAAVIIVAAAPHRGEAFEACRHAIDTLKKGVPIWKKEYSEAGTYWVEENP